MKNEKFCWKLFRFSNKIPVTFMTAFYIANVVSRYWDQFISLPWPDRIAYRLVGFISGQVRKAVKIVGAMFHLSACWPSFEPADWIVRTCVGYTYRVWAHQRGQRPLYTWTGLQYIFPPFLRFLSTKSIFLHCTIKLWHHWEIAAVQFQ